jgi:diaminopimelate decarboxylase
VRRVGTPLYLYDLARLRTDADTLRDAFPDPWLRLYSLKANALPGLVRVIRDQGYGVSAVSRGEVELARRAGVPPSAIALEGIGKTDDDLGAAVARAVAGTPLLWTSLESVEDAATLARLAANAGVRLDVLVRVNPRVAPETTHGLAVGDAASKFGVLTEELPAVITAGGGSGGPLCWRGIQLHVGSQLGAVDAWRSALRVGLRLLELQRATLTDFDTLDAGGGFPVEMGDPADRPSVPSPAMFAGHATAELERLLAGAHPLRVAIEPGRAVVAGCGWLVARVLHVRRREPPIVVIDGGMTELIRPALYGAHHPLAVLTSLGLPVAGDAPLHEVRVDGPVCESTDSLGAYRLPELQRGDVVALGMAGAYGASMASTYNGRPLAPEVAWDGGRALRVWRRRPAAARRTVGGR